MASSAPDDDAPILAALDEVAGTLEASAGQQRRLARRLTELRNARVRGRSWLELMKGPKGRDVLASMRSIAASMSGAATTLRRSVASALRADGLAVHEIAGYFGVSHQRVSKILASSTESSDRGEAVAGIRPLD